MVLEDRNLVAFQLSDPELSQVLPSESVKMGLGNCEFLKLEDVRFLFHSIRDENPSLFGRKDRPAFPTGVQLSNFGEKILQAVRESQTKGPPFLFLVWKEDDSLNPHTRIRRTSFYFFCESQKVHVVFGEWKKDIVFQNHFTFSEWITSPRFKIQPTDKERFFILESARNHIGFHIMNQGGQKAIYPDWIVFYPGKIPPDATVFSGGSENQNESQQRNPKERLKILEELRKEGLITESEYQERRLEILKEL